LKIVTKAEKKNHTGRKQPKEKLSAVSYYPGARWGNMSRSTAGLDLPNDVLERIFEFLEARHWARICSLVCKQWHDVSTADSLWESACKLLWKGKAQVQEGQLFARARFREDVDFSVRELKHILQGRAVVTTGLLEKSEFKEALRTSLSCLPGGVQSHVALRGKWKASYVFSLLDARRKRMTDSELCSMRFRFFFKSNPFEFSSTAWFEIDPKTKRTRFRMDPWPMENVVEMPWKQNADGGIVIHTFPEHVPFRRPDWSWCLENDHVIFFQSNFSGFNEEEAKHCLSSSGPFDDQ
jgi:hypothetical protein